MYSETGILSKLWIPEQQNREECRRTQAVIWEQPPLKGKTTLKSSLSSWTLKQLVTQEILQFKFCIGALDRLECKRKIKKSEHKERLNVLWEKDKYTHHEATDRTANQRGFFSGFSQEKKIGFEKRKNLSRFYGQWPVNWCSPALRDNVGWSS